MREEGRWSVTADAACQPRSERRNGAREWSPAPASTTYRGMKEPCLVGAMPGAMQLWIEWLIGGVVSVVVLVGVIPVVRAIVTGLAISRRPSHHLARQTGTTPVPPEIEIPPTFGR
jgi:hypothetical protein